MRAGAVPPLLALIVILAALPLPGGTAADLSIKGLSADDTLTIQPGETVHLRPEGSVWGRIVVAAADELTLSLELSHDTMEDLDVFSDDGEGIYDEEHHTFFYLSPEGTLPQGGYRFEWWGTPEWAIWPSHSGPYSIDLDAGDEMDLVAINNVPGFTITLHADGGGTTESTRDWQLADHPGYSLLLPDPESGGVATPVAQSTSHEWEAEADAPPAILKARGWEYRWDGPRVTIEEERLEINGSGGSGSGTSIALGPGGHHFSASTLSRTSTSPDEVDFLRYLEHTTAGPHRSEFGAGFLVLPYLPPT